MIIVSISIESAEIRESDKLFPLFLPELQDAIRERAKIASRGMYKFFMTLFSCRKNKVYPGNPEMKAV